jgi:hypothetical protein
MNVVEGLNPPSKGDDTDVYGFGSGALNFGRWLPIYRTTLNHIPDDSGIHSYRHENLKSHIETEVFISIQNIRYVTRNIF